MQATLEDKDSDTVNPKPYNSRPNTWGQIFNLESFYEPGITSATVSLNRKKFLERLGKDKQLRRMFAEITEALEAQIQD